MIPILYHESETIFSHNGIGQLYETIDYTVIEERNGSFTLELEYPADGRWATEIKDHRLISAKPNDLDEPHTFRINEIVKDVETQTILVFADTITNDLSGNMIIDVTVVDKNAQHALDAIKAGAIDPITYNLLSDIQTLSSSRWTNLNPLSCLSGTEGSIVSNWGGEIKRTNNAIHIYGRRGIDNSARIYPGHGLDGFKMTVSTKGLVTHILPYVMYTRENQTEPTMVRGFVVASPLASNYPIKSIIAVDFSGYDEIFPEDELSDTLYENTVKTRLDGKAAGYFTYMNPDIDKPKVTVDVNLASLSDSSEYEQFKTLEHIGLTDTVDIWVEDYNIDVNLKIHTVEYSGLTEMVKSFKAGSVKHGIYSDVNATYEDKIDKIKEYIGTVENGIYNTIRETADGQNNIFSGYTTPDPTAVKDGDLWYKPLGSGEVEMYRWTDGVWNLAVTNADKIVMGSIDANLVNLVNLNANNISTGTIQGANGAWNLNTGVLYLGSSLADAQLLWDGTNLTIKLASGKTVEEYVANTIISTEIQYRLSTSRTTLDGGTWSDIAPPPENGKYLWSRTKIIKKSGDVSYEPGPSGTCISGANGYTPIKGTDYFDGQPGTNGLSSYLWVRYSQNANGDPMVTSPIGAVYIGVATTTTNVAPTLYGSYSWSLIKGTDGNNGVKGETGADGKSSYLHIKYSDNGTTFTANGGETVGKYIGTYVDFIEADSTTFGAYTWNKVRGEDGVDGQPGANGVSTYTWVKYADTSTGTGMTNTPDGKLYMGIAHNKPTATESSTASDYTWSLIKGTNGLPGANGETTYTWVMYADDEYGNGISTSPVSKRFLGLAHNKTTLTPSVVGGLYTWSPLYDNVKVGGRNLILDSKVLPTSQGLVMEHLGIRCNRIASNLDTHTDPAERYSMPLRVGDKVVLSVDVAYTGTKPTKIEFYMGPSIFNYTPAKGLENLDSTGKFVRIYVATTVIDDAPYTRLRVRMTGGNSSSYVYFAHWKLEKGNIPTDWSAAPEELYTGITRIDQDGINVSQSGSTLNTQIAYNGISIFDKNSIISSFGDSGAVIPFADIEKFKSNDITRTFRESITLNVGPGYTFTSISAALDWCFTDTIRILLDNAVIILNVYGQFFDDVILRGITGSGAVRINMANSSTRWIGSFHAIDCSARVYIAGANSIFKGGSTKGWAIFNENSKFLSVSDLNIDNTDSTYAVRTSDGGRTTVMSVDISGGHSGFYASYGGEIKMRACRGNVTNNGCLTRTNGTIYARESTPVGGTNWNNLDGFLYREANTVALASAFSKPPVTSKTFTKTFTTATFDTLHNGDSVDSYYGASGAQNRWTGMSGWKQARIRMGSEISSFISGGTSVQTQIRLRRKNTSHGSSGGITPTPSHGMSSATQGAWTGWGVIASSNFGSSVDLRFGSNTYSNYAIWDAIEVWVSVVKSV